VDGIRRTHSRPESAIDELIALSTWYDTLDGRRYLSSRTSSGASFMARGELVDHQYDPRFEGDIERYSRAGLLHCEPFYVSQEIGDMTWDASASLNEWEFRMELLPTQYGFVWLEGRYAVDSSGVPTDALDAQTKLPNDAKLWLCGFSWFTHPEFTISDEPMALITVYHDMAMAFGMPGKEWFKRTGPLPMSHIVWQDRAPVLRQQMERASRRATRAGQFIAALLQFMDQELLVRGRSRAPKATRKRAERSGLPINSPIMQGADIQLVVLRRTKRAPTEAEGHGVDWSCRWVVRGHWHRYHTRAGLTSRWLLPYEKGPEGKPLKVRGERLWAVTR
jgi:hypothetical protein